MIGIKNTLPKEVKPSLILYGKPKSGKSSTLATFKKAIICDLEKGYEEHFGFMGDTVNSWDEFLDFKSELKKNREWRKQYSWVIIDTMPKLYEYAKAFIREEQNVQFLDSLAFGKGHIYPTDLVMNALNEIKELGYGIIYVLHSNEKEKKGVDDKIENYIYPVLESRPFTLISADVTATIYYANEKGKGIFCLGRNSAYATGSRLEKYLPSTIPATEDDLINAFTNARIKKAEETGIKIEMVDKEVNKISDGEKFAKLMAELKELYATHTDKHDVFSKLQLKVFGEDFKQTDLSPLLNTKLILFLDELKKYIEG